MEDDARKKEHRRKKGERADHRREENKKGKRNSDSTDLENCSPTCVDNRYTF